MDLSKFDGERSLSQCLSVVVVTNESSCKNARECIQILHIIVHQSKSQRGATQKSTKSESEQDAKTTVNNNETNAIDYVKIKYQN